MSEFVLCPVCEGQRGWCEGGRWGDCARCNGTGAVAKPKVVTLCGSSRFKAGHEAAMAAETLAGNIVIPMGLYGHVESVEYRTEMHDGCMGLQEVRVPRVVNRPIDMDGPTKSMLGELHLRKIDVSDEVLVVNPRINTCIACGKPAEPGRVFLDSDCCHAGIVSHTYVGESTRREIAYAKLHGKVVRYMYPNTGV